jgi:hypothetical protein
MTPFKHLFSKKTEKLKLKSTHHNQLKNKEKCKIFNLASGV